MKKFWTILFPLLPFLGHSQAILTKWLFNENNNTADYHATTGSGMSVTYVWTNSTTLTDVTQMCYDNNYVYVKSQGVTDYMGKFLNPGTCIGQNYTHKIPRTPTVPTTKSIAPKGGAIGLLTNGIPMFGLGNAASWSGTANANPPTGKGIWNVEVYKSEGFVLDTAFAAHPQQQGAYHSHAAPYRLYKYYATTVHSPIVGWAFDGYPVYGPYGYSSAMDATSSVTRMKTGYSLRSITTRTTLPNGTTASQTGPAVSATYPLGTYCEDYAWSAANGGHLDEHNARFCVTPEFPSGTYAYFATISAAGVPEFPYLVGVYYYGAPETTNYPTGPSGNSVTLPTSGVTCVTSAITPVELMDFSGKTEASQNKLTWTTASEINVNQYVLERSSDGKAFEAVGFVKSAGNSNQIRSYSFTDATPLSVGYYRLRSIDNDGKTSVSKTILLIQKTQSVSVFPTTTTSDVQVVLPPSVSRAEVVVFDLLGRPVLTQNLENREGSLNLSDVPNGVYLITIRANSTAFSTKILKK